MRTHPGGVAPSTTPINGRSYRKLGPTSATDSYVLLFGFLPIKGSNATSTAVEAAKRKQGADALIDVTVDGYFQWWILFTRHAIEVRGTGIQFTDSGE
ncbi:MAG: hypothetical protein ACLFWL_06635 [Candidatus Brocadiia bacterium]